MHISNYASLPYMQNTFPKSLFPFSSQWSKDHWQAARTVLKIILLHWCTITITQIKLTQDKKDYDWADGNRWFPVRLLNIIRNKMAPPGDASSTKANEEKGKKTVQSKSSADEKFKKSIQKRRKVLKDLRRRSTFRRKLIAKEVSFYIVIIIIYIYNVFFCMCIHVCQWTILKY